MTNEEMTLEALKLCRKTRIFIPANEYLDTAINSLEENAKLKSEIEQLKAKLQAKLYKKDFKEFCDKREEEEINLKFREENEL